MPFTPDDQRELVLVLAKACQGIKCGDGSGNTCDQGQCTKPVVVGGLPRYTPGKWATPPDAAVADATDAAEIEVGREAGPRDSEVDVAEAGRTDVPALLPDAQSPDVEDDVPAGSGGTGGTTDVGGTGGGAAGAGGTQTGGSETGGVTGSGGMGGSITMGGRGGIVTTAGTSGGGGVDGGAVDAPGSGGTTVVGGASGGSTTLGGSIGGASSVGGTSSVGGATGGTSVTGGITTGGTTSTGGTTGSGGSSGTGGATEPSTGPCDIYALAGTPCVAAYSMVRVLSKSYAGPLFQVRAGSSSTNNTMSGGTTQDIMPAADGYVDSATVDTACGATYCTVSVLYDHSGSGNHIMRAPRGNTAGGATGALDDYESIATKGLVGAGGHTVYSLYMNKVEGYRTQTGVLGNNMPMRQDPQGIYELADGTRNATACCWDFGNVTPKPATEWAFADTLCFATTWWGKGDGSGPWFGVDFEGGVWAGGTKVGDPGYGGLANVGPANTSNPSLKVPFALGFLRVSATSYAIRVANLLTATDLTTAYEGGVPVNVGHKGGIVLGVGTDNSNNSSGTFYEGAIIAGYPTNETELAVMKNIQAVGYSK